MVMWLGSKLRGPESDSARYRGTLARGGISRGRKQGGSADQIALA